MYKLDHLHCDGGVSIAYRHMGSAWGMVLACDVVQCSATGRDGCNAVRRVVTGATGVTGCDGCDGVRRGATGCDGVATGHHGRSCVRGRDGVGATGTDAFDMQPASRDHTTSHES